MILFGESLILEGVRAELAGKPNLEVITLDDPLNKSLGEIHALNPAVIIFDLGAIQNAFPFIMLHHPDVLLIGIDPESHQAMVWAGQQRSMLDMQDLMRIVQRNELNVQPFEGEKNE